ncbi:MAG: hypothetical protein IPN68_04570 [Bacteroidetes bacterium]|nr:hypothetical protein [Bacteroidota bacterium]
MKTLFAASVMTALLISGVNVMAQNQNEDYLGLPGDNLNLYAVMNLFQESKTLEEFERNLNDENSRINNLDLNADNMIDYINVFDIANGNVHNIVMQVAISEREKQDVAVFSVERDKKGNVMIQLTGDEDLYGKNYIIEPVYDEVVENSTPNPGYTGNAKTVNGRNVVVVKTTVVEVARWPMITYIYDPGYVVWRSSWYWGYYPSYWRPWRPYYWHYYYGYHYNYYDHYYSYYHRWNHHRYDYWNDYYNHHHTHSVYVSSNIREGHYKSTYSRPEERKKGEELYATTHRDSGSGTRRNESVRVADQNRRSESKSPADRSSGNVSAGSSRRSESGTSTRTTSDSKSGSQVRSTENRSRSEGRSTESRASSPARSDSKSSTQVRSTESRSRETSKSAAPAKRESRPKESVKRESQPKSKESSTKKESKTDSKRR